MARIPLSPPLWTFVFVASAWINQFNGGNVAQSSPISVGQSFYFAGPHSPYSTASPPAIQITLGYGTTLNTIGNGVWFSRPGVFDLPIDQAFSEFALRATNGLSDFMSVTVTDGQGYSESFDFNNQEWMFLGNWPDLASLTISSAQLRIMQFEVADVGSPQAGQLLLAARWEFFGIPEPSSATLLVALVICVAPKPSGCRRTLQ